MPEHLYFGGGVSATVLHPVVAMAMVLTILAVLALPRRLVYVPLLLFIFVSPAGEQIYVGGLHWTTMRIVILAGCLRLVLEELKVPGGLFHTGLNGIDRAFAVWAFCVGLAPILLFRTSAVVPVQMASWLQTFGGYFMLRFLIQDVEDIRRATKTLAVAAMVLGLCMANEHFYSVNIFGYLGSGPIIPTVRNGLIRAQACFAHPILAGCFGGTLLPLFYWLWKAGRARGLAALGMVGSTLMVVFSVSSTPLMVWAGGIGALFLWLIRRSMRMVRWGIVAGLLALAAVMKAPVWFLIARVNLTGSSDAYDRAMLIDNFLRHFKDWWLIGADPSSWSWGMWDLSNQFVGIGERGGLVAFIAFIAVISLSFSRLGKMRKQAKGERDQQWLCWCLGAVMFAHILAYFGVSYFDQTQMWWLAFLAMVSAATAGLKAEKKPQRVEEPAADLAAVTVSDPSSPDFQGNYPDDAAPPAM